MKMIFTKIWCVPTFLIFCFLLLFSCNPFYGGRFNNFEVVGYVRSLTDSTAIPAACLLIDLELLERDSSYATVYTDSLGYYEYAEAWPTEQYDTTRVMITVMDVDGVLNGSFLTRDTILYNDDLDASLTIIFETDIYVEMVTE